MAFNHQQQTLEHNANNQEPNFREIIPTTFSPRRPPHSATSRLNNRSSENDHLNKKVKGQGRTIAKDSTLSSKHKDTKDKTAKSRADLPLSSRAGLRTLPSAWNIGKQQSSTNNSLWKEIASLEELVAEYEKKFELVRGLLKKDLPMHDTAQLMATIEAVKVHLGISPSRPLGSAENGTKGNLPLLSKVIKRKRDFDAEQEDAEPEKVEQVQDDVLDLYVSSSDTDDSIDALFRSPISTPKSDRYGLFKTLGPFHLGYGLSNQNTISGGQKTKTFRTDASPVTVGNVIRPLRVSVQQTSNPDNRQPVSDLPRSKKVKSQEQAPKIVNPRTQLKPKTKTKRKLYKERSG